MTDENKDKHKKSTKDDSKTDTDDDRPEQKDDHPKKTESAHEKPKNGTELDNKTSRYSNDNSKTVPKPSHDENVSTSPDNEDRDVVQFKLPTAENAKGSDDKFILKPRNWPKTKSSTQRKLSSDAYDTSKDNRADDAQSDRRSRSSLRSDSTSHERLRGLSLQRRLNLNQSNVDVDDATERIRRQAVVHTQIEEQVLNRLAKPTLAKRSQNFSTCTLNTELSDLLGQFTSSDSAFKVYPGTEQNDFDFSSERKDMFTTNILESIAHLIKGCLGVGVLSIHEAWMHGGMWASLGAMVVIGFLAPYSMNLLVKSAQKLYQRMRVPKLSFADLAEASIATGPANSCRKHSKLFRYLVDISIVVLQCCSCSLYQLACATTLKKLLERGSDVAQEADISVRIYVVIITAPLICLCLIKRFRYLSLISMIADIVIGLCIITAVYYSIKAGGDLLERPAWKSPKGFFNFCGVCLYSVDGISLALPIENNMKYPRFFTFTLIIAMGVTVLSVAFVGFFGYWGWGEDCQTPITLHIKENTVTTIMESLLIAMIIVTFAVQFWVPFRILWRYVGKRFKKKRGHWENLLRLLSLGVITIISVAYPYMNSMMGILGDVVVSMVAFIFPPIIDTLVTWSEYHGWIRWTLLKNCCIILFGLVLIIGALVTNVLPTAYLEENAILVIEEQ